MNWLGFGIIYAVVFLGTMAGKWTPLQKVAIWIIGAVITYIIVRINSRD